MLALGAGCKPRANILMPERPPAPLDRPIGVEDDAASTPEGDRVRPPTGLPIGAAAPVRVVAAAPDGQWVALCQGSADSEGSSWSPVLVVGAQEGTPVDRFVAFDPTGRHVSFVKDGALMLLDTIGGANVRLRDVEPSERTARSWPWVDFDGVGERVAYIAATDDGPRVRVRSLTGRGERELDPGVLPGPATVHLEERNGLRIEVFERDVRLDPDAAEEIPLVCRPTSVRRSDAPIEVRHTRVDRGEPARVVPGAIASWQGGLLVRGSDGAVSWRSDGAEVSVVDAQCRGRVLHRDRRGHLLVACHAEAPASVRVYAMPGARNLVRAGVGFETLGSFATESLTRGQRWWLDREHGRILLVDPPRLLEVDGVEEIVHVAGRHVLVRHTNGYALVDRIDGRLRMLDELAGASSSSVLRAGSMAALVVGTHATIVDVERGRVHGRTHRRPLAVTRSGHVLVPANVGADDADDRRGPLVWLDPVAVSPSDDVGKAATGAD